MTQTLAPNEHKTRDALEQENQYLNDLLVAHALQGDINLHREGQTLSQLINAVINHPETLTMDDLLVWKHFALLMENELDIPPTQP